MVIRDYIHKDASSFYSICQEHQVKTLYAFGSSVSDKFHEVSDVDLLVEVEEGDPLKKGELLLSFWNEMEIFFQRKIDLLTSSSISNPFLEESIENTKVLLYDESVEKIFG